MISLTDPVNGHNDLWRVILPPPPPTTISRSVFDGDVLTRLTETYAFAWRWQLRLTVPLSALIDHHKEASDDVAPVWVPPRLVDSLMSRLSIVTHINLHQCLQTPNTKSTILHLHVPGANTKYTTDHPSPSCT